MLRAQARPSFPSATKLRCIPKSSARTKIVSCAHTNPITMSHFIQTLSSLFVFFYAAVTFPYLEFTPNEPMRKSFFFRLELRDISSTQNHMYLQLQFEAQKKATNCSARQRAISLGRTLHNAHQVHAPCTSLEIELRGKMLASSKAKLWNFSVCGKF